MQTNFTSLYISIDIDNIKNRIKINLKKQCVHINVFQMGFSFLPIVIDLLN